MFEHLKDQPADALLSLIKMHRDDPREHKIDLGVGVYRDETGVTPVMRSVKTAEKILLETQTSKSYLGPEGDMEFVHLLEPIIFGRGDHYNSRLTGIQTPGGTGALRVGIDLIVAARPNAKIWLGLPSWPNHAPIFTAAGADVGRYNYFDIKTQTLRFDDMMQMLQQAAPGDAVLLNGACHNPTGADLSFEQWQQVTEQLTARKLLPLIDFAYQGLGLGLDEDAQGLRYVLDHVEEAIVAYSCDKNFGVYRDRVGALYVLTRNPAEATTAQSNAMALARVNWSMPPDHGAAVVRTILSSEELTKDWRAELTQMNERINGVRTALAAADPDLAFIASQRGLFSNLSLDTVAITSLRIEHAVYMAGSGRINIAGLQHADIPRLAEALRTVMPERQPAE
ncbi:amino acid aminotransferase [Methylovirgula sp. 4M-Z18]|uniref:amino acid aminotransferase n=1 Tax=Methylovirgula sp. 4M-Z18 TaxID=2293567 RepID=UPI000E2FE167|nr:amino acid aminotransferase [Methylovirgula sp. 4M-Z18]RFB80702.1 aspartate/tyrosine/aromatic aminotransferase [Methylovirgula sp. 4M-Z18]